MHSLTPTHEAQSDASDDHCKDPSSLSIDGNTIVRAKCTQRYSRSAKQQQRLAAGHVAFDAVNRVSKDAARLGVLGRVILLLQVLKQLALAVRQLPTPPQTRSATHTHRQREPSNANTAAMRGWSHLGIT